MSRQQFLCAINPVIGHEYKISSAAPRQTEKSTIAGGGIAGMQAALTACERGHQVILFEKSGKLGGAP
jgi:NADPH-dependent 2,4-dienoyl-CoA reductase/sulfur reductase-like enzyme